MGIEVKYKGNKFTCHKAEKLRYTSTNSIMDFLVLYVPTMTVEPQLKRYCTIFTLDGTIKIYASQFAQYISNLLSVSSIIAQIFNTARTPSIITAQTRYCAINIAHVAAP
jgi:hypothetical protein